MLSVPINLVTNETAEYILELVAFIENKFGSPNERGTFFTRNEIFVILNLTDELHKERLRNDQLSVEAIEWLKQKENMEIELNELRQKQTDISSLEKDISNLTYALENAKKEVVNFGVVAKDRNDLRSALENCKKERNDLRAQLDLEKNNG